MHLDLMHTYSASRRRVFQPVALGDAYLFASMKVAVAIALVGAIVGELPTGAVALGARLLWALLRGTIQIWSALFMAAFLSALLVPPLDRCLGEQAQGMREANV